MTETTNTQRPKLTRRILIGAGVLAAGAGAVGIGVLASRKGGAIVPGKSRSRLVESSDSMPTVADVVVVGGGNIGCLAALTLAERGVKVALCEKGVIAGEASGRSLGYVDSLFLDPAKVEIVARSKQLWQDMNARVGAETGYRRTGIAALLPDEQTVAFAKQWIDSIRSAPGAVPQILASRDAAALAIGSPDRPVAALYEPTDGIAEPQLAAPAVADQVRRLGGAVLQNCAVRGVETTGGRISGVITESGHIACSSVILAGGIWSPIFLRSIGLDLPQFMAFSAAMRFAPAIGPAAGLVSLQRNMVMRRTLDGSYDACKPLGFVPVMPSTIANAFRLLPALKSLGGQLEPVLNVATFISQWRIPRRWALDQASPFEENRVFMPEYRKDILDEVARNMRAGFPQIGASQITDRWAGAMMTTLDNMPVISAVDTHPGLIVGSGFYYGLTMAPAAGEALADLVMGRKPQFDLKLYRFSRFDDGSAMVFRS